MWTRASIAKEIADWVMYTGAMRGHIDLDGGCKVRILDFLDQHHTAATLDGWIQAVRIHGNHHSEFTMAFILCHAYLREQFPQDVQDDFLDIGSRNWIGQIYLRYVLDEQIAEPYQQQIPQLDPDRRALMDTTDHWAELRGLQ